MRRNYHRRLLESSCSSRRSFPSSRPLQSVKCRLSALRRSGQCLNRHMGHKSMSTTRSPKYVAWAGVSAFVAAAIALIAFLAICEKYRHQCLYWGQWNHLPDTSADTNQVIFLLFFAMLFFVAIILFGGESSRAVAGIVAPGAPPFAAFAVGAAVALLVYASLALATWATNPWPGKSNTNAGQRFYLSALWPIGLLQETGNFQSKFCGE